METLKDILKTIKCYAPGVALYFGALIFCFVVWGVLFKCCSRAASASPLNCESIGDHDRRQFCRAVAKNQKSYCEFIKNKDLRQECRARASQ